MCKGTHYKILFSASFQLENFFKNNTEFPDFPEFLNYSVKYPFLTEMAEQQNFVSILEEQNVEGKENEIGPNQPTQPPKAQRPPKKSVSMVDMQLAFETHREEISKFFSRGVGQYHRHS